MKKLSVILCFMLSVFSVNAAEFALDRTHTSVSFTVTHLVVSEVIGQFDKFKVRVKFNEDTKELSHLSASIEAASVNTSNKKRDRHLRSSDFFESDTYPTIEFKSKKITRNGNKYAIVGNLKMKDVTKEVTLHGKLKGIMKDSKAFGTRFGMTIKTEIDRQEFNLNFNKKSDLGDAVVGDDVEITIRGEFIKR